MANDVSAEALAAFYEAGTRFMERMESDRDNLAEQLGVTPEVLDHFAQTMDYQFLARHVIAGGKADEFLA